MDVLGGQGTGVLGGFLEDELEIMDHLQVASVLIVVSELLVKLWGYADYRATIVVF